MLNTTVPASDLAGELARLAPAGVATAVAPVPPSGGRLAEHAAGRRAAERAIAALGATGAVVGPMGERPVWPAGLVGSISHTGSWATAVVASTTHFAAIGLDLDREAALPADDAAAVCSAAEQRSLTALPAGRERDAFATLLWMAKEAAFKAWDPWCDGRLWGVDPALLAVDARRDGSVVAHPAAELAARIPGLPSLQGGWVVTGGTVAVLLSARSGEPPRPS